MRNADAEPVPAVVRPHRQRVGEHQGAVAVVNVVSSTSVRSTYRRVLVHSPLGAICQCPASRSSSRPNTDGLSKRGKDSHSTEPAVSTKAHEWRSERRAWSAMAVVDMTAPGLRQGLWTKGSW